MEKKTFWNQERQTAVVFNGQEFIILRVRKDGIRDAGKGKIQCINHPTIPDEIFADLAQDIASKRFEDEFEGQTFVPVKVDSPDDLLKLIEGLPDPIPYGYTADGKCDPANNSCVDILWDAKKKLGVYRQIDRKGGLNRVILFDVEEKTSTELVSTTEFTNAPFEKHAARFVKSNPERCEGAEFTKFRARCFRDLVDGKAVEVSEFLDDYKN